MSQCPVCRIFILFESYGPAINDVNFDTKGVQPKSTSKYNEGSGEGELTVHK